MFAETNCIAIDRVFAADVGVMACDINSFPSVFCGIVLSYGIAVDVLSAFVYDVDLICTMSHGFFTQGQNSWILLGAVSRVPAVASV